MSTDDDRVEWKDYLEDFVAQFAEPTDLGMELKISSEELEALGEFFVQGLVGWALGIQVVRQRPRLLVEITPKAPAPGNDEASQAAIN